MKNFWTKKFLFSTIILLVGLSLLLTSCGDDTAYKDLVSESWLEVDSLKETFVDSGIFENIGFAVSSGYGVTKIEDKKVLEGLKYHATSVTAENAFKPDGIMWGLQSNPTTKFTSSKGKEIYVPDSLNFSSVDNYLSICKSNELKMRGHVLVWHSQTPDAFFRENFDAKNSLVGIEEMEARQEWYIKTVLEHIKDWETKNNNGEHIIYCWDVVNEAVDDGATGNDYLRKWSNWYSIYKSDKFIVDAFRYANKYAPSDVLLAYNDYNEYQGSKHDGILKVLDAIIAEKNNTTLPTRIDVVGMQSHMSTLSPSKDELETAIKNFIDKGLDIHITELDITGKWLHDNECERPTTGAQTATYKMAFSLYKKYAKSETKPHGVTGVTIWGINDEASWRGSAAPLLFKGTNGNFYTKTAFYGVIETAKE